jgi:hypothetical protein
MLGGAASHRKGKSPNAHTSAQLAERTYHRIDGKSLTRTTHRIYCIMLFLCRILLAFQNSKQISSSSSRTRDIHVLVRPTLKKISNMNMNKPPVVAPGRLGGF